MKKKIKYLPIMLDLKPYRPVIKLLSDMRLRTITGAVIYMRFPGDLK